VIDCLEFRRRVGAEPAAADAGLRAHRAACAACARHQDELLAMDATILRALRITPPPKQAVAAQPAARAPRRRIFAIAASLAAGLAIGLVLLVGAPRDSVAREVMDHVTAEQAETMASTASVAPGELAGVLDPDGTHLKPGAGDVTFAARCTFDGRVVPHLVVRTPDGPVTVLMLRHRSLSRPLRIAEQGYEGVVLPAPKGSIAVVGRGVTDIDAVARRVFDAVDWGR
jgi:hypothetical protein